MVDIKKIPCLNQNVCFEKESDQYYLYNSDINVFILLDNEISIEIIRLCNSKNTIKDIVQNIFDQYTSDSSKTVKKDILNMISTLNEEKFLTLS